MPDLPPFEEDAYWLALEISGPATSRVLTIDHVRYHVRDLRRDADGVLRGRIQGFRCAEYEAMMEGVLGKVDG